MLPPCQGMDLTAFGSNHLRSASRAVAYDGSSAGLGEGTVTATPMAPVAPTRGLRVQGMPWRQWLRTTPGRLRAASAILLLALLLFAVVTTVATEVRSRAAGSVQTKSAPELVAAERLYGSLADADATASTIYLRAGAEPRELRQRYLERPPRRRTSAVDRVPSCRLVAPVRAALRTIGEQTAACTSGLVDTARANIRLGIQEGGAYLRTRHRSSCVRRCCRRRRRCTADARRLDNNYRSGVDFDHGGSRRDRRCRNARVARARAVVRAPSIEPSPQRRPRRRRRCS